MAGPKTVEIAVKGRLDSSLKRATGEATSSLDRFAQAQRNTAKYRGLIESQRETAAAARIAAIEIKTLGLAASGDQVRGFRAATAAAKQATAQLEAYRRAGASAQRGSFAAFDQRAQGGRAPFATSAAPAAKGARGTLGLKPYELQNLGYQVNDFFTQIASGTSVTQAFAQQAGQVAQLFPAMISGALRLAPAIGLITAALSPFIASLVEVQNRAGSLKAFDALLTSTGNGANYSKEKLTDLATSLDAYGGSLADARAALSAFVRDDVATEYLDRFGKSAINLSKVMKIDVTDAASQVSKAFTGNVSDILSLDDSINFLSTSERDHIELLQKSGREAQARTEAFGIFERRYDETAAKMRGSWSTILANFDSAWKNFVHRVNFIDFSRVKSELGDLMNLVARLSFLLDGVNKNSREALVRQHGLIDQQIRSQQQRIDRGLGDIPANGMPGAGDAYRTIDNLERERDGINRRIADIDRRNAPATPPADTTLDPPKPPRLASSPASAEESAAERLAKAQAEFNDDLVNANASRARGIELLGETTRETAILQAIEEARKRAADGGLTFTEGQAAAIRASVGASEDAKAAQEAFNEVSRHALELAKERGEVETRDAFIRRNLTLGDIALETEANRISRAARIDQLNQAYDAERRADAEKAINDLLSLRTSLQTSLDIVADQGDGVAVETLRGRLVAVDAAYRAALVAKLAYWRTQTGGAAEAERAQIQAQIDGLDALKSKAVLTAKSINESLMGAGMSAFDRLSQIVAETGNAFTAARESFLLFAADFLREIARMIAQAALMKAFGIKTDGTGGAGEGILNFIARLFHDGGVVGSGGSMRAVSQSVFAGAVRYHEGGIAGLAPNEIPAILQRGEEVLTAADPRHRNNGGGGQAPVNLKNIVILDPGDLLDRALGSDFGERVFMNFIGQRAGAIKATLG